MEKIKIDEEFRKKIVVSLYDKDDFFIISKDKKIYKRNEDGSASEVLDTAQKIRVLKLFEPAKTDVIRENDGEWLEQ